MTDRQKALSCFQRARVLQEANGEYVKCISCGRLIHVSEADGGHYEHRQNRVTELYPQNVHAQCHTCNRFKNGNLEGYRQGLLDKFGEEYVDDLENLILASKGCDDAISLCSDEQKELLKRDKDYKEEATKWRGILRKLKMR